MSFRKTMMKFILESKKSAGPSVNQRSKDSILVPDDVVTAIKKIVVKHPTGLSDSLLSTDFIVSWLYTSFDLQQKIIKYSAL